MAKVTLVSIDSDPDAHGLGYVTVDVEVQLDADSDPVVYRQSLCGIDLHNQRHLTEQLRNYADEYESDLVAQQAEQNDPTPFQVSSSIQDLVGQVVAE